MWDAPLATTEDLEEAIAFAREAQSSWGRTSVTHRQALLKRLGERLEEHREELVAYLMKETGKSVGEETGNQHAKGIARC